MLSSLARKLLPSPALVALALLCAFFAIVTLQWVRLHRAPPNWDDAWYLANSLVMYDTLVQDGPAAYARKFFSVLGFKAPLITVLPTPVYLVVGRHWRAAFLVNAAALALLLAAIYAIGKRLRNPRTGLLAAAIAGSLPLVYGLSRWYLVEIPLAAAVALAVWLLLEWRSAERSLVAILFGTICGLGLLLKVSFPAFILPVFLCAVFRSKRPARLLIAAGIPCLALALPWYAVHYRETIDNALRAAYGDSAIVQGTGPIFSLSAITAYLAKVVTDGVSLYFALLALALVVALLIPSGARGRLHGAARREFPWLALWIVPFLVFLFGGNKDVRYIAPILPAFALALACLIDLALPQRWWAHLAALLLLVFPVLSMMEISFAVPRPRVPAGYARRYSPDDWLHRDVFRALSMRGGLRPGVRESLLVGTDRASFNANNFELFALEAQLPLSVSTTAYETDRDALLRMVDAARFFVYKDGGEPESSFFNKHFAAAVRHVLESGRFTEIPFGRVLPDGGVPRMFRNDATASAGGSLRYEARGGEFHRAAADRAAAQAAFGGMLDLVSLSAQDAAGALDVRFRWRCTRTPGREYWCFVHVLDMSGNMIGNLDHRIREADPPLRDWRPGDVATEVLRWRPSTPGARPARIRLGLYDVPTNERLPVVLPPDSSLTLADNGTAVLFPIPLR